MKKNHIRYNKGDIAMLIAIGKFSPWLQKYCDLDRTYSPWKTIEAQVSVDLLWISGEKLIRDFALCLGITDPEDFSQHEVLPSSIDYTKLRALVDDYVASFSDYSPPSYSSETTEEALQSVKKEFLNEVSTLRKFANKDYLIMFRPPGSLP